MKREWLGQMIAVINELTPVPTPAGCNKEEWRAFIAGFEPGDELWTFTSPYEDWQNRMGRTGYAQVRGSEILNSFVTLMN